MSPSGSWAELALQRARQTEFDVSSDNFSDLEIRDAGQFFYFYDNRHRRLIKSFVLRYGPRVDTLCDVLLVKDEKSYTPRLTLWKRDKTKATAATSTDAGSSSQESEFRVKARVEIGSENHESFWKLINFLQAHTEVDLPIGEFRITSQQDADLLKILEGQDKDAVLQAVRTHLSGQLTEADVQMLLDRRKALNVFHCLLTDPDYFQRAMSAKGTHEEGLWQKFFEQNTWIFGYGLKLVACDSFSNERLEQITTGANVFTGGGKRNDALMRTRGFLQTLLLAEIKRHDTALLMRTPYRDPDVYQVSKELSGAVSQVQKTAYKAVQDLTALHHQYTAGGSFQFEFSTIRPRQVVVVGNLQELDDGSGINVEKMTSFELYRRSHQDVEILTFDELYARSKFIVEANESGSLGGAN